MSLLSLNLKYFFLLIFLSFMLAYHRPHALSLHSQQICLIYFPGIAKFAIENEEKSPPMVRANLVRLSFIFWRVRERQRQCRERWQFKLFKIAWSEWRLLISPMSMTCRKFSLNLNEITGTGKMNRNSQ